MSIIPINLSGTVAADPQSRTLPSGRACASFRLAVNHWRLDKGTGEYLSDTTSWFSVDCYGPLASNCSMSLHQGMSVVVQGTLKIREWSTDEKRGIAPTVVAEHIGPDLRYGTANYQKSSNPNRQTEGQQQTAAGGDSGWDSLAGEVPPSVTGASDTSTLDSLEDTDGVDEDGARDDDGGGADNGDDAIARETVKAAAPF
ncbi:single-stranded DNA-binding protein [Brevibacterium aurantiacum]|uniref:Single-stranded DNA-binding protein n=1 Tax=Brevibacterium aurantiacum TaxID=273384 RepID=A0A2H1J8X7_BREAU|nr:single-stranded DNA-binding protein [Brevibacterium aurantiacum]SMX83936.1 single-strand DNA-binding protein [Brevibacterium aurantiacum]